MKRKESKLLKPPQLKRKERRRTKKMKKRRRRKINLWKKVSRNQTSLTLKNSLKRCKLNLPDLSFLGQLSLLTSTSRRKIIHSLMSR